MLLVFCCVVNADEGGYYFSMKNGRGVGMSYLGKPVESGGGVEVRLAEEEFFAHLDSVLSETELRGNLEEYVYRKPGERRCYWMTMNLRTPHEPVYAVEICICLNEECESKGAIYDGYIEVIYNDGNGVKLEDVEFFDEEQTFSMIRNGTFDYRRSS